MQAASLIASIALGVTFLLSGVGKLREPGAFVVAVLDFDILPARLARVYALSLPVAEVACGAVLLVGYQARVAALLSAALLLSFSVGVGANLVRGRNLDCHCFGPASQEPLGWVTVVRISVLLACAGTAAARSSGGILSLRGGDAVPLLTLSLALLLGLYLIRAIPRQLAVWRLRAPSAWKEPKRGRMIWLHNQPLVRGARMTPEQQGADA